MPFRSERQRRFLFANHPKIARKWAHEDKMPQVGNKHFPYTPAGKRRAKLKLKAPSVPMTPTGAMPPRPNLHPNVAGQVGPGSVKVSPRVGGPRYGKLHRLANRDNLTKNGVLGKGFPESSFYQALQRKATKKGLGTLTEDQAGALFKAFKRRNPRRRIKAVRKAFHGKGY